jgi:hypothetical protein
MTDLPPESFWDRVWPLVVLAAVYSLMAVAVPPKGEFPTNDDWAYARVVKTFLETGRLQLGGWVIASLVFQVFWGALFCLPTGFSFAALRTSTLVMSFFGVAATYAILREYGCKRNISLLGALTLAVNPLYVSLSYTFMTDVPALTMMLLAALFYLRGLRRESDVWLVLGSLCALSAFLVRQTSLVMTGAFALWVLLACRSIDRPVRKLVSLAAVPALGLALYVLWYHYVHAVPPAYNARRFASPEVVLFLTPRRTFHFMQYLGLFLLPVWAGLLAGVWKKLSNATGTLVFSAWVIVVFGVFFHIIARSGDRMPYLGNVLTDLGLGVRTLRDTYIVGLPGPVRLSGGSRCPHWPRWVRHCWVPSSPSTCSNARVDCFVWCASRRTAPSARSGPPRRHLS